MERGINLELFGNGVEEFGPVRGGEGAIQDSFAILAKLQVAEGLQLKGARPV